MNIHTRKFYVGVLGAIVALLMAPSLMHAAPQAANFVGTWQMTVEGRGHGGEGGGHGEGDGNSNGNGNGGEQRRGGGAQTLTITQDGDKFKVTHKTPRSEEAVDATVAGNTISWTESRQGRDGNTRTMEYKATLDGDSMQGTMAGKQFTFKFTATRSANQPAPDAAAPKDKTQ